MNKCALCHRVLPKNIRTLSQNALYWLFLDVIEKDTGNNASDLHEFFKAKLLPPKFIVIKGKKGLHEVKVPRSTTELGKVDFGEYMDKISAMVGIKVPDPHDLEGFYCGKKTCTICK